MSRHSKGSGDEWPGRLRRPSLDDLRSSLWFWPAVAALVGAAVATALGRIKPAAGSNVPDWAWPGDRDSAVAFLQVVAGSVITVTSLTFTLVVVALQLASQQFSPRLLREFARDLFTQIVLGTLVTTFVIAVTVLRQLDHEEPLPVVALALTFVMALLSVAALLGFLGHIARLVRVDTMMAAVHRQTRMVLEREYQPQEDADQQPELPERAQDADVVVCADTSGFVHRVAMEQLVASAVACDGLVVLGIRPGDHVVVGTPLAQLAVAESCADDLVAAVHKSIELGYERTAEDDVGLGLRQLTDIAVKALSPGINDPATANHSLGHLTDLLVRLQSRALGPRIHADDRGTPRVHAAGRDLRYFLDLVISPIRRYGAGEPTVIVALLRMLRDIAVSARGDEQRGEIARQADLVAATLDDDLLEEDVAGVRDLQRRVHLALAGDVAAAYEDRAGETRSY